MAKHNFWNKAQENIHRNSTSKREKIFIVKHLLRRFNLKTNLKYKMYIKILDPNLAPNYLKIITKLSIDLIIEKCHEVLEWGELPLLTEMSHSI